MKKILPFILFCCLSTLAFAQVTWSDDIACIVYTHCSSCHNDVGIGPFNLMNYQDAYNNRYSMDVNISDRTMPPWPPDQSYRAMAHANSLTDDEIALFSEWVLAGAPEGDPMAAPETPVFETNEEITDPDVVLTTELFTVPDVGDDLYKCFVIQTDWTEDRFVSALEMFPNNRNIVHHVLAYTNITDDPVINDQNDPAVGFECGGSIEGGDNVLLAEWVPGSRARILPEGTGIRIPAGANILIQVHYPEGTEGQSDFLTFNLKFAAGNNIREVFQDQTLDHQDDIVNGPLAIFPFETKTFHEQYTLPEARTFLATAPHAHNICTRMWSYAELPNGDIVNMVDIPNWDFDWQGFYEYPEPIVLPAGTVLHGYARYQNDNDNPNNPNNPPAFVLLGEETEDEMMLFFYSYLYYEPGDENIVMGGGGHLEHHGECETPGSVGVNDLEEMINVDFFPNPIKDGLLHIKWDNNNFNDYQFELTDISGKRVLLEQCNGDCNVQIPATISDGFYIGTIRKDGVSLTSEKIVIAR